MAKSRVAPALAVTMGEPAGIGIEITLKAWLDRNRRRLPPFLLLADPSGIPAVAATLGVEVPVAEVTDPAQAAAHFDRALPVAPLALPHPAEPGRPDPANAVAVLAAIERAVAWARTGEVEAVVTNPIQKASLYHAGFAYQGHTDFLADLCNSRKAPVMMLVAPELRVVPVTVHVALRQAIDSLTGELIVNTARTTAEALARDFACARPRLAVAGLNPHAGEAGSIGSEEIEIIAPAIARLCEDGLDVVGPMAADSMFHPAARARYDAALCMYHDQALIPLKTIDFEGGVNVTLGLDIVRTSPDHGTALDIAGSGRANAASLVAALRLAAEIAERRAAFDAGRR